MKKQRRRPGSLSDDDLRVWKTVARTVTPLDGKTIPDPGGDEGENAEIYQKIKSLSKTVTSKTTIVDKATHQKKSTPPALQPLAPLEDRLRRKLIRGRVSIDARIDLHGMTQDEAYGALNRFLSHCSFNGHRLALVITGKGTRKGWEGNNGILRRMVPQWLRRPDFRQWVIGLEEAHPYHGGEGALYVRIRRRDGKGRRNRGA